MENSARPLPNVDEPDTGPFWRATKERVLRYQVCTRCSTVVFPPRPHCPECTGLDLDNRTSGGLGTVHACTTTHQHSHPYFHAVAPYTIGLVDLDEGFRMLAELSDSTVTPGSRVHVDWEEHDEVCIPIFTGMAEDPDEARS